jgi:glycosyltransferase involved in cell wall biosynthesis
MKLLVTGNYDHTYNRTKILLKGLKNNSKIEVIEFPIASFKQLDKTKFKQLANDSDFIYLPPFTHSSVKIIKKLTNKPIIFDPLISKYLTKVFDYKQISKYSPRAYKNYLKDKIPLQKSDLIIADTLAHKNYFSQKFKIDSNKIKVLPIGADTSQFYPTNKPENSIFEVGFYGGFIPLQGVTHIIEAAQLLQSENDIQFNLIGTGFEWEKTKQLVKKLNLKNINFLGWAEYDNLPSMINSFDICLGIFGDTPKTDMVIPNKIFHYAALKKCILTKDTPAIKEIFTNQKNILLTNNNPKEIAKQILNCKNNTEFTNKIATAGYDLITTKYNEDKIATQFIEYLIQFKS